MSVKPRKIITPYRINDISSYSVKDFEINNNPRKEKNGLQTSAMRNFA